MRSRKREAARRLQHTHMHTKCHSCHSCLAFAQHLYFIHSIWCVKHTRYGIQQYKMIFLPKTLLRLCISRRCVCLAELNISDSHAFVMIFVRIFYLICIFGLSNINYTCFIRVLRVEHISLWKFELHIFCFSSVQTTDSRLQRAIQWNGIQ